MTELSILPQPFKISNMKNWILIYMLLTGNYLFAQVIPVGFLRPINTSIPTGTNPVTTNLLLYLDATRRASYDASGGSIWYDISGLSPANSATLVGSPTFSVTNRVGSFTMAANNYVLTSQVISSLSSATFIAWVNPAEVQNDYTGIITSRGGFAGASGGQGIANGLMITTNNSRNLVSYVWNGTTSTYLWRSLVVIPNNEWSMIAVSIDSNGATAYILNSGGTSSATNPVSHPSVSGHQFYIGVDPYSPSAWAFKGKIATSMVYSTALTLANITSIFNAQKAAFGI